MRPKEHRALLSPFMRQGLGRHEKVLYIVDDHTAGQILAWRRRWGRGERNICRGQLSVLGSDESYVHGGVFEPERMMALLRSETERAAGKLHRPAAQR
jgi:hypothetical protein